MLVRIATSLDASATGNTRRTGDVWMLEPARAGRQVIQVRSAGDFAAIAPQRVVSLLIRDDKYDVRFSIHFVVHRFHLMQWQAYLAGPIFSATTWLIML